MHTGARGGHCRPAASRRARVRRRHAASRRVPVVAREVRRPSDAHLLVRIVRERRRWRR